MTSFTLLLPVYAGNSPEQFELAFRSSVHEQIRRPDEALVVVDGPIPAALQQALEALAASSPVPVRVLRLPVPRQRRVAGDPRHRPGRVGAGGGAGREDSEHRRDAGAGVPAPVLHAPRGGGP